MARSLSKPAKRQSGRTGVHATPLNVRPTGVKLDTDTRAWVEARAGRRLGKFATHIERVSLRFEDVNGPRGGKDKLCRAKVVLSGLPSVVVEQRGQTAREAFDLASAAAQRAVRKAVDRAGSSVASRGARGLTGPRRAAAKTPRARPPARNPAGSLVGRRVGQSMQNIRKAAERPEKLRRDVPVDTSLPGVSASDRKVGKEATATRNTKLRQTGMVSALEDSATGQPSRKSTRRSQNRSKSGTKLERRAKRKLRSPQAKARRASAARA